MGSSILHVGGKLTDVRNRALAAVRRAEAGEEVRERHLTFLSFEQFRSTLTPKRLDLLRHLHRHPAAHIKALAAALGRDYKRVHEDVRALEDAGLIERSPRGELTAGFDEMTIETRIALGS